MKFRFGTIKNMKNMVRFSIALIAITVAAVIILFQVNLYHIDQKVSEYTSRYLNDIIEESKDSIEFGIQSDFSVLETVSAMIAEHENLYGLEVSEILKEQAEKNGAAYYNVISRSGDGLPDIPIAAQILDQNYMKEAFQGNNTVSDIVVMTEEQEILFNVPVYQKGQIRAVLQFGYNLESFAGLFENNALGRKADTFVIQTDGTLVSRPGSVKGGTNLFSLLENLIMEDSSAIADLKTAIRSGEEGSLIVGKDRYKRYLCYTQIPENGWYVVTIMSANVVENNIYDVSERAEALGEGVILIFVLLLIGVLYLFVRLYFHTKINSERYQIVAEQSGNIIFEYNYDTEEAYHNYKWYDKLGYEPISENYISGMTSGEVIVPEDKEVFESIFVELRHGAKMVEKRVRIYDKDKNPIWFTVKASGICDRKGRIYKVIGRYIDVDQRIRTMTYWQEQAEIDWSTGLLNKEATLFHIAQMINQMRYPNLCAVYLIDIDGLNQINQTYGQKCGDEVIGALVNSMKQTGREDTMVGRAGDDEFLMALPNVTDRNMAEQFAVSLLQNTEKMEFPQYPEAKLCVSIGIVLAPLHGRDTKRLLERAEEALRTAKKNGSNSYHIL